MSSPRNTNGSSQENNQNIVAELIVSAIQLSLVCAGSYYFSRWLNRQLQSERMEKPGNSQAVSRLAQIIIDRQQQSGKKQESTNLELNSYEQSMAEDVVDPKDLTVTFKDVGGLDKIKQELWQLAVLPLKRPDLFGNNALVQPPKGILLYGKPGTG